MKNLVLHEHFINDHVFLDDMEDDPFSEVRCTLDPNNGNLYVMFSDCLHVLRCEKNNQVIKKLGLSDFKFTKPIALEYCILTEELYCAYEAGQIITIKITVNNSDCTYFIFKDIKSGLKYMKLSPDHEVVSVVTGAGMLVLMHGDGQVIKEVSLYSTKPGKKEFSSVGWGKKETQFHGSAGKAAAKAQQKQLSADESDKGRTLIAWQGDGKMLTVSFLHPDSKRRLLKTFDREGSLLYTSEDNNGYLLGDCLAWKPFDSRVAVTTKTENNCYVTYYEKNGLKYKDFIDCQTMWWSDNFGSTDMEMRELLWSPNADILAIFFKHKSLTRTMIQLWTECNGRSYLKQTICFPDDCPVLYAAWITVNAGNKNTLALLTLQTIEICSFNWCVDHSRGKTEQDLGLVCVIDANKLHITSLRKAVKPPPASHYTLEFTVPINAVVFAPDVTESRSFINSNVFCVVTYDNIFSICRRKMDASKLEYEIFKTYIHSINTFATVAYDLHHICWFTENLMLCSMADASGNSVNSFVLKNLNSRDHTVVDLKAVWNTNKLILHIISLPNMTYAYILTSQVIYRFTENSFNPTDIKINELCCQVDVMQEIVPGTEKHFIIFLTHTNRLLINGFELSKNILSFFVHTDGVIFTTLQHYLVCLPFDLSNIGHRENTINIEEWSERLNMERSESKDIREIERGAHIILAIPRKSQVILQVPRGNLETVEIKVLIVRSIMRYLDECDYKTAFDVMRKHHVNLNLMYDHNPYLFIEYVEKFVDQFANAPTCLTMFLSALKEEDCTKTLYAYAYGLKSAPCICKNNSTIEVDKVSNICKLLNDAMEKRADVNQLIYPILLTLLKGYNEKGLKMALMKLKQLLSAESDFIKGLKYLLNSVNINLLYDTALSTYDIELAMFVVSKSQKDPKEYIPFLNSLRTMDENYMKYTIDMHLKHYESALKHIAKDLNKFDKCLNLVCKHKLYKQALKLFQRNTEQHKMIATQFGNYLLQNKMYHEAATMFHRSGNLIKASEIFILAGSWENAIIVLNQMNLSRAESNLRYLMMVKHLRTNGKYIDAATILLYYLRDPEQAVTLLCNGRSWKHAMRIAYDVERSDLTESCIKPGIQQHANFTISHLNNTQQEFLKHKSRLSLLRSRMHIRTGLLFSEMFSYNKLMDLFHSNVTNNTATNKNSNVNMPNKNSNVDMPNDTISMADTVSTVDTQASMKSVKSYRSSKSRRKQERKLLSLKEGSMFEDFGLINALYHIIANTYKNTDEWRELIEMLVYFEFDEIAEKLQNEINNFFRIIQGSKMEIWDKYAPTSLDELRVKSHYSIEQMIEIAAPLKPLYKFVTFPPDTDVPYLDIV